MLVPGYSGSEYLLDTLVCFDDWHWHWDTAAFSVTKFQLNHWARVCNMLWFFSPVSLWTNIYWENKVLHYEFLMLCKQACKKEGECKKQEKYPVYWGYFYLSSKFSYLLLCQADWLEGLNCILFIVTKQW